MSTLRALVEHRLSLIHGPELGCAEVHPLALASICGTIFFDDGLLLLLFLPWASQPLLLLCEFLFMADLSTSERR